MTIKEILQNKAWNDVLKEAERLRETEEQQNLFIQEEENQEEVINGRTNDIELDDLFEEEIVEGLIKKMDKGKLRTFNYYIGAS